MKRNLFSFPRSQMVGKMLRAMSFVVAVFWATTAMADIVVKGVVADDSGLPIPGANVTELNSKGNGTITNVDGQYSIVVKGPKSVLRFSFIGYTKEDVTVGNKTQVAFRLRGNGTTRVIFFMSSICPNVCRRCLPRWETM